MFRLNPGFFYGEADAMTTLFLMKIGKECFFKLVRYIFFIFISILVVVGEIAYWKKKWIGIIYLSLDAG
jgi:hypothetical protein